MSIEHNGVPLFGGFTHSDLLSGKYEKPLQIGSYFQVKGETHIVSQSKGRDLWCDVEALGYGSEAGLNAAIKAIRNYAELPLHGTLIMTYFSGGTRTEEYCTFLHLDEQDGINYDASTGTYWKQLTFFWRQAR
ncbi:MAG: hypothetical protein KDA77_00070 [Planctomycetaceae bacterium]|nr:hypothetical protein [Planctomycetaceae bacterium]